jgi:NAD(P)-dependent dehydrogenase (short-subunit alcohol dehydrogenase family)
MFEGKVVLVTGGATGLGRATALAFARQQANIAVVDLNESAAQETANEVRALSRSCCVIRADVSGPGMPEQMVRQTVESLGRLDILVNNAATWAVEPFLEITEVEWTKVFDVNVKGLLFCLLAAARAMRQTGGGKIINISSPASHMALPNYTAYAASKAAVDSITRSAAIALGKHKITVNSVAPGRMDTAMQRATEPKFAALAGVDLETFVQDRTKDIPLGRRTSPEEVAGAILWLASPQADYVTGERLNFSGGLEVDR